MSGIPDWMVQQLEFPYLAGSTWVSGLWASGGWDAVDAAYDQPPASTEQVLHPEKYISGEQPAEVADPDVAAVMGSGWTAVESSTVGEAMLGIWLGAHGRVAGGRRRGRGRLGRRSAERRERAERRVGHGLAHRMGHNGRGR